MVCAMFEVVDDVFVAGFDENGHEHSRMEIFFVREFFHSRWRRDAWRWLVVEHSRSDEGSESVSGVPSGMMADIGVEVVNEREGTRPVQCDISWLVGSFKGQWATWGRVAWRPVLEGRGRGNGWEPKLSF